MKRKFTFLIAVAFMLLTMIVQPGRAWGQTTETEDVTLSSGTYSTDHIVWSFADGNITIQQLKGTSSTAVNSNYIAAPRVYKGHYLSFVCSDNYTINSISIKCDGSYYGNSMTAGTVVSNNIVTSNTTDISATWTTTAGGSHVVSSVSDAGLPAIYIQNVASANNTQLRITKLTITYTHTSSSATATTVTIDASGITNTDVYINTAAGSLSASVTETESGDEVDGATVTWSSGNTSVATIDEDGVVTLVAVGTTTITASYAGESGVYSSSSATYNLTVTSSEPYVQPTTIEITPNYTFWGKTGQFSGSTYSELSGSKDNVSLDWSRGSGSTYANTTAMRFYKDNTLVFTAPTGYEIKSIVITVSGTYDDLAFLPTGFNTETTTWTGSSETVTMSRPSTGSSYATISQYDITIGLPSNTLSVTYNANNATSGSVPTDSNEYESGDEVTVLGNTGNLVKTGYIWSGWNTQADGNGTTYQENETFTISANTTLYAKWDAKTITSLTCTGNPTASQYAGQAFNPEGLTVTATFNDNSNEDVTASVVWTPNQLTIATTSVTGTYMGLTVVVEGITVTYAPGTENNPYTVAQAIAATPASGTSANVYIHGIVSSFYNTSIVGDGSNYRYRISDDGTTTTQLLVYKGKGLNQETFTDANDLLVGDEVVIYGTLNIYNNAPQIASGNYLYSWVRPVQDVATPTFSVVAGTYANAQEVEISCETDGATIYYTLDGTEPTNESTLYNGALNIETTTTVKAIAYKNTANSYVATATYHICSADNPYTVAQALAFLEYPANGIYVSGIVSTAPTAAPNNGQLTYYISDNGEAENELEVYKGKNLEQADFTAKDDIQVGDIVTVFGNVVIYGTSNPIKEFASGNYLTSFERPTPPVEPSITVNPTLVEATAAETQGTIEVTYTAIETDLGASIYWYTDNTGTTTTTAPEWILAEIDDVTLNVDYVIEANEGEARTAYFKVYGIDTNGDDVYSDLVTISQEEYVAPTTASITVELDLVEATAEGGDGTLTVTYENITEILAQVYFCDENGDAATYGDWIQAEIDDNNNVYYVIGANDGEARTAYFKVYALDDNAEDVYSNLVTINQEEGTTPPTPGQYEWVATDLADLTADDVFVIVGNNGETYAMSNDNGTSSAPSAVAVTITNNALSGTIEETIQWNLSISDDGYTFYPNGTTETWLYCTAANNGIRVGTNANKIFVLDDSGYMKNTATSRYLGIYNSSDWRCYTSYTIDNIKNQTFAFYKRVPVSTEPSITLSSYTITDVPAKPTTPSTTITETLTVTIANIENFDSNNLGADYCNADGSAISPKPDFIGFEFEENPSATDSYILTCTFGENNDPEARTAYFKVTYNEDEVVSQVVTATQLGYVAPTASITLDEYAINATADETQGSLTVILENMTISDVEQFSIDFFHQDGSDFEQGEEKPDWVTAEFTLIENVYSMNYTVGANTETTERNAYFKVYGLDDDGETEAYSDLVTVTQAAHVPPVVADNYELFSETLVEGDYIIVYDGVAMNNTVTNDRLQYSVVTIDNDVISTSDAAIVWHIAPSGDYWTIYNAAADAYAASTGAKNKAQMLADGTDDKALWTASGTYDFVNKQNTANNVNATLRYNAGYGFACYATSTGGALSLFKKVDNTPSITITSPVEITADAHNDETIDVTYKNVDFEKTISIAFYTSDGETSATYDWITAANINVDHNVVYTTEANTGDARSAYFKVIGKTSESADVISNLVTITQAAYVAPVASITVDPATVNAAAEGEDGTLTVTYENITEVVAEVYFCNENGDAAEYDWITAEINNENNVEYLILENDGEARTAYFKVYALDDNAEDVYSNLVTVTQDAYVIDYATMPFTFNGGRNDIANVNGLTQEGLDTDYSSSPKLKFNTTGDWMVLKLDAKPVSIIYDIKGNGFSGGTFSVQVSEDGVVYNDLEVYNALSDVQTDTLINNNDDVRYIKWIYTSKSSGNVALGNIQVYDVEFTIINISQTITDLIIEEGEAIVVNPDVVLELTGTVTNTDPDNLIVRDGGQLIHNNTVNATVQKSVTGASSWGKGVDGWYLIASPVHGAPTSAVTIGQYDLFVYNEPTAYWWVASGHGVSTFSHGQGFLYANAASVDLNFAGEMVGTETSVSVDLSYTSSVSDDVRGFNLVGNPFSRNLEDGDVMWNTETNIAYLTMNPERTDFVTVNISERPIKPGEGFFFQAKEEGQQLVFNPTTSKGGNGYIKIVAGNENGSDNAYINIANGNTIRKFNIDNGTKVYVMEDNGDDYAAARVEELAGSMLVNFKAAEDGEYTITVNAKNIEAHTMILFDDFTGETIDLLETPSYTFNASVNDSETRFKLIFDFNTYTGIGESYTNGNFAYQTGDEILLSGEGTLQVFDVMGRHVASFEVNGSKRISTSLFNTGVYIFKMTGENNMTQKIVVR